MFSSSDDHVITAVGESCAIHTDCVYVAECAANRTCICRDTYVPNPSNNTTCLAGVNNSCDYDEDCIDNAFCLKQSHCECMDGRTPTKDRIYYNTDYASAAQPASISVSKMKISVAGDIHAFLVRKNVMGELADQDISTSTNMTTTEPLKSLVKEQLQKFKNALENLRAHTSTQYHIFAAEKVELEHDHDADTAACFSSAITQSDFLVALELDVHCFSYTLQLSKYLQSPNWDLSFALYQEYAVDK
ncbi:unnamed protein product [Timema podura]|uniref:EB domain-containing protein n=1 Tax=Timema podura TaxID=61482 RepID=A0ABN7P1K8_TIMPD|nr:unnamed protein product [Timema podura]